MPGPDRNADWLLLKENDTIYPVLIPNEGNWDKLNKG